MRSKSKRRMGVPDIILALLVMMPGMAYAQESSKSSYMPVVIQETFQDVMTRMKSAKSEVMKRQKDLLNERYDRVTVQPWAS